MPFFGVAITMFILEQFDDALPSVVDSRCFDKVNIMISTKFGTQPNSILKKIHTLNFQDRNGSASNHLATVRLSIHRPRIKRYARGA